MSDSIYDTLRQLALTHEAAYLKEVEKVRELQRIIDDEKFPENVRQEEYAKLVEAAEIRVEELAAKRFGRLTHEWVAKVRQEALEYAEAQIGESLDGLEKDLLEAYDLNVRMEKACSATIRANRQFWFLMAFLSLVAGAVLF